MNLLKRTRLDMLDIPNTFSVENDYEEKELSLDPTNSVKDAAKTELKASIPKKTTLRESFGFLLRKKLFWTFLLGLTVLQPAINQVPVFILDIFLDRDFRKTDASFSLVLFNIASAFGRLSLGFILKVPKIPTLTPQILGCICGITGAVGILLSRSLTGSLAFMFPCGFTHGVALGSYSVVTMELFGVKHMSNAMGVGITMSGLTNAVLGPTLGMWL